ncbi:hypothetical protein BMG03_08130 [Thioclava nitratireducens]|uniref:Peptidylprolyl isomerase n=1 Tax=Thioclava nitratireducens TaxID=1915078 RepID=A0ABM6IG34_9RHOB|nr:hypothetical protein [Thioclava nitratireducens]AQS47774.1 hypothetical protein BMG03_08130 [Thioclava nitratireducens]
MKAIALIAALACAAMPSLAAAQQQPLNAIEIQRVHALVGNVDLSSLTDRQIVQIKDALVQNVDRTAKETLIRMALKKK